MELESDVQVLLAARTDAQAFEELYRRHRLAILRFAARRAEHPQDVVDLVGAIWLEVADSLGAYDPTRGEPVGWMLGIAANLCAADRRRRRRERDLLRRLGGRRPLDEDDYAKLENEIDASAVAPRLREALASLPRSERAVAELVLLDELTPLEAAEALRIHPAAVRMRLSRARRKLRAVAAGPDGRSIGQLIEEVS